VNQSKLIQANTGSRRKSTGNVCQRVAIGFDFTSDWMTSGTSFSFSQSLNVIMQNQANANTEVKSLHLVFRQ